MQSSNANPAQPLHGNSTPPEASCVIAQLTTRSLATDGEMLTAVADVLLSLFSVEAVIVLRGDPARDSMLVVGCFTRSGQLSVEGIPLSTPPVGAHCVEIPIVLPDATIWGMLLGVGGVAAKRSTCTLPFVQLLGRLIGACF